MRHADAVGGQASVVAMRPLPGPRGGLIIAAVRLACRCGGRGG